MLKNNEKIILTVIILLVLLIIAILIILNELDKTEMYTISRDDGEEIINNLLHNNTLLYEQEEFNYNLDGNTLYNFCDRNGKIVDSDDMKCNIKVYTDGRVVGKGYYINKSKQYFEINGKLSEEDIINLKSEIDNAKIEEVKYVSGGVLNPEFKLKEFKGKEIVTDSKLLYGKFVKNGKEVTWNEIKDIQNIREILIKYCIVEVK